MNRKVQGVVGGERVKEKKAMCTRKSREVLHKKKPHFKKKKTIGEEGPNPSRTLTEK